MRQGGGYRWKELTCQTINNQTQNPSKGSKENELGPRIRSTTGNVVDSGLLELKAT